MFTPFQRRALVRAPSAEGEGGQAVGCSCGHVHANGHGHAQPAPPPSDAALISARGLKLTIGGRKILDAIDLDVSPGEIVTLIGPNGAGKTTLVKILLGIETPDRGTIKRRPGKRIGYVPQRFEVDATIPMTVEAFLSLGGTASAAEVKAALVEAGAERAARSQLSRLSGGETQRVLIARALLRKPDLLILDEPARGVDFTGEAELYKLLARLRDTHGLGILLVSHDLHVVMANSDRVICLNGHVCCSGKPEHVSQHAAYARIFGPQGADALGVYRHHHDHAHDISGAARPLDASDSTGRGS